MSGPTETVDIEKTARTTKVEEHANTEGSYYQGLLGGTAKKNFFKPLDSEFMHAVHQDAESVVYTPEEEVSLLASCISYQCS